MLDRISKGNEKALPINEPEEIGSISNLSLECCQPSVSEEKTPDNIFNKRLFEILSVGVKVIQHFVSSINQPDWRRNSEISVHSTHA